MDHPATAHREKRDGLLATLAPTKPSPAGLEELHSSSIGSVGAVWATDPRDYRDCVDDGAGWALLLGPILSGSMFYETCVRLRKSYVDPDCGSSDNTVSSGWYIEPPLVSRHTKVFCNPGLGAHPTRSPPHITTLALSALAASRKQACHSMCLFSLLLLAHILWSRRRLLVTVRDNSTGAELRDESRGSDYWTRRSEWQRTIAIIGFSTILTAAFVSIKVLAQIAGVIGSYGELRNSCKACHNDDSRFDSNSFLLLRLYVHGPGPIDALFPILPLRLCAFGETGIHSRRIGNSQPRWYRFVHGSHQPDSFKGQHIPPVHLSRLTNVGIASCRYRSLRHLSYGPIVRLRPF